MKFVPKKCTKSFKGRGYPSSNASINLKLEDTVYNIERSFLKCSHIYVDKLVKEKRRKAAKKYK